MSDTIRRRECQQNGPCGPVEDASGPLAGEYRALYVLPDLADIGRTL